jgi:acetyl-CoA carboxylase carboxyltransferase component
LVDSEGVSVGADEERSPASAAYARLACAYASATTPRVTVITGKAYGSAFALMGSRALGADLVLALPEARVGAMTPEMAVAFVWNDKVTNDKSRSEVEQEWIEAYALPEKAAAAGDIDDIVSAAELRMRICSAIYMLATAAQDAPTRRHTTSPM